MHTDVTDVESVHTLAERAYEAFGAVHVLCNNAGVLVFGKVAELRIEDWRWVYGVNVFGVINGLHEFVPRMLAQGTEGHIVNTASVVAFTRGPGASRTRRRRRRSSRSRKTSGARSRARASA